LRYHKQKKRQFAKPQKPQRGKESNTPVRLARKIVGSIFFSGALIWFLYFFLFSKSFKILTIHISGNQNIPLSELRTITNNYLNEKKWIILKNNNILIFPETGLAERIREKYIIEDIQISRNIPFELNIKIKEKLARVVLRTKTLIPPLVTEEVEQKVAVDNFDNVSEELVSHNNVTDEPEQEREEPEPEYASRLYYLDVNGIIIATSPTQETDLQDFPVIEIYYDEPVEMVNGNVILNRETIELIFALYEALRSSSASIEVSEVIYDPKNQSELKFVTREGWQGFLSTKLSLDTQIKKLELALSEKIKDTRKELQYVDLRVKDRVYFK
jgi:hypothetical protein